jgi:hypothetical protein
MGNDEGTTFAGKRPPFRTGLLSAPFLRDLAEIMALIGLNITSQQILTDSIRPSGLTIRQDGK